MLFIASVIYLLMIQSRGPAWIIEEISYHAQDGFELKAWFLRPRVINGKYPAVACFHHAWGNRDDFLKLFPYFAESGIIAISPNLPRELPNYDPTRFQDLTDTINYLETLTYVDAKRIGMVTSSLSVNTGALAIQGKPNVIADVMLSGPIMNEDTRKWLTINSDLALFIVVSKYEAPNYDLMREYYARSLHPLTRAYFIDNPEKKFVVENHGIYLFDTYPSTLPKTQQFFKDVFHIQSKNYGYLKKPLPANTVYIPSSDGFPFFATFALPKYKISNVPAVILYPPRYQSRTYYDKLVNKLLSKGIAVLAANNKRTCRYADTEFLCDREIKGAVNYLLSSRKIDKKRTAIVFPSPYFLTGKSLVINNQLPLNKVIFVENGDINYGIVPQNIKKTHNKILYLPAMDFDKLAKLIEKEL